MFLLCFGGSSTENSHILGGNEQNDQARARRAGVWSRGVGAEARQEEQPSPSILRGEDPLPGFSPSLGLPWSDCFQQEFGLFQPKCNSKKISQDSSGTQ